MNSDVDVFAMAPPEAVFLQRCAQLLSSDILASVPSNNAARIQVVVRVSWFLAQELRAEDDVVTVELLRTDAV